MELFCLVERGDKEDMVQILLAQREDREGLEDQEDLAEGILLFKFKI